MPLTTYREALKNALSEEIERDDNVLILGEEVAQYNGAYKVTEGLWKKFGDRRIVDTPISEAGFVGMAIGASMLGLRPVVELMFWSFAYVAYDQIINNAGCVRYMSGGLIRVPIVIRGPANGGGLRSGARGGDLESRLDCEFERRLRRVGPRCISALVVQLFRDPVRPEAGEGAGSLVRRHRQGHHGHRARCGAGAIRHLRGLPRPEEHGGTRLHTTAPEPGRAGLPGGGATSGWRDAAAPGQLIARSANRLLTSVHGLQPHGGSGYRYRAATAGA